MRIAAFDLGSNSFHLIVVEARLDGSFTPLVREKEMLRLGDVVARDGAIGPEAGERAFDVVRRFKAIADAHHADEIIAVGTAALREAVDGAAFVDSVRDRLRVDIKVVDGVAEAQTIFTAVRASVLIDPSPALAADLGGGSLEIMVGDQSDLAFAASVRLGVGRLTSELVRGDPPTKGDLTRLSDRIRSELDPILVDVVELKPKMLIGSSGTFISIARLTAAMCTGRLPTVINQLTVSADDLIAAAKEVFPMTAEARAKLPGCDARRSELLPAGFAVLSHLMNETGLEEVTISEWALREGLVLNAIGQHDRAELDNDPRALRRFSVLSLCRRSNWRQPHGRQVAALATALFDATADLHGLGPGERELLELGALMHDIGEHVSRSNHDKHTAYLIENGELRGFDPVEVRMLSLLGQFHIRGNPKNGRGFSNLSIEDQDRILTLVAILRLADALDATHSGAVQGIAREGLENGVLTLSVSARRDVDLEMWTFRRKKALFEKIFDVTCELRPHAVTHGDFEIGYSTGSGLG